jgi:hypothetical protein
MIRAASPHTRQILCFDTRLPTFFFIGSGRGDDDNNDCRRKESTSILYK